MSGGGTKPHNRPLLAPGALCIRGTQLYRGGQRNTTKTQAVGPVHPTLRELFFDLFASFFPLRRRADLLFFFERSINLARYPKRILYFLTFCTSQSSIGSLI